MDKQKMKEMQLLIQELEIKMIHIQKYDLPELDIERTMIYQLDSIINSAKYSMNIINNYLYNKEQ